MSDTQTIDNTPSNTVPTVEQFKTSVNGQLTEWNQSTIEGLCRSQSQTVIEDLVQYYGDPASSDTYEPDVETFKQVIRDFQEQKERPTFADITDPEVQELIVLLAPHFQQPPKEEEEAATNDNTETSNGDLDKHPF